MVTKAKARGDGVNRDANDGCDQWQQTKCGGGQQRQATIVDVEWQWVDDGKLIMTNNNTNEAVHHKKCAHHQRVKIMLVVVVLTICLPVRCIPNQA